MNNVPQHNRFRRIILLLIAGLLIFTTFLLIGTQAANRRGSASPLSAYASYDPATYGIPYEIGGYKVLAVKTSANTACLPAGNMNILLQSPQSDAQSFLANSGDTRSVVDTLRQLPSLADVHLGLEYMGPGYLWNPEQFMASNADWNTAMKNGCITLGPSFFVSDTPDPFAPYDPATYNIPEIVAGYRILVVQNADNTACMMPTNAWRVLIQPVDPMPDNPMVAKGNGDVIFELKKLYPNIEWEITYSTPSSFDRAHFVSDMDNYNRGTENGCISWNRPIVSLTPDPFAAYAPATYGLPEIVAGYRIVAVHSSSNTPCMPVNMISLTIQAVDPSPDNPMVDRNGGDIIFEVKKMHPDIDWQLEYTMPGRIAPANRVPLSASTQQWIDVTKEGCVILGGPEFTVVPSATP